MKILLIHKKGLIQFATMHDGVLDEFEDPVIRMFLDMTIRSRLYCIGPFIPTSKENHDIDLVLVREGDSLQWFRPRIVALSRFTMEHWRVLSGVKKEQLSKFHITQAGPMISVKDNYQVFGKTLHLAFVLSLAMIKTLFMPETEFRLKDCLDDLSMKETEVFWAEHAKLKIRRKIRNMIDSLLDSAKDSRAVKYLGSKFKGYPERRFKGHTGHIDKTPEIAFLTKHFGTPLYRLVFNSRIGKPTGRYVVFELDDVLILEPEYRKLCSIVLPKEHEARIFKVTTDGAVPVVKRISDMKKYGRFVRHDYQDRATWKRNLLSGLNTQTEIKF